VLLLLLAVGYLFVPRISLENRSPLAILSSPTKREIYICAGTRPLNLGESLESLKSESACTGKYGGHWQKDFNNDGSVRTKGYGWSDIGNLISKDLTGFGGLFLLIGASPAIGFMVFQRISESRKTIVVRKKDLTTVSPANLGTNELSNRLENLQSLYQKGLITSEEFSVKKREMLEEI